MRALRAVAYVTNELPVRASWSDFVDAGVLRYLPNRGKRLGNFVLSEFRQLRH
jgi:hypothetical protein